ncbi:MULTISPECIES: PAS domain-containing protein [unclassified Sphingomonas]|uniref:PAS domain-containing protein n=1 Tax=unclassified Sphingomonas TaxID=196159 RepID=UPI0010F1BA64|nr:MULTISPECIES: PAS domain-containing protein [unclassified Sphingomonas]MBD8641427.1 PAS domain-containing protein [Sphingomonas sp. CFBP 13733]MBD8701766.1 PAS domain-containing protein [Sphingomonas sp. CFBP 13714]MBP2515505.1 PAS domain-containing protein [Sphingomonas sp. PvP018]RYF09151.1 MAG: PAS domain S-box protein [Oxalobacteraceae bacterium]
MPAAHCVSTLDGVILQADQGFLDLLQRRESDLIGISYRQITDPRDLQRSGNMLAVLEAAAAPVRLQKRYLRPDGTSIAANLLVTRFSDPDRLISTLFWHEGGRDLPPARLWEAALRIRHVHDARVKLFGADLSTDPIGSLLIGIYLAEAEGRAVGLNQIATYADVAISTATRWVAVLRQRNIIDAQADATFNLQLTRAGLDRVEAMLTTVYEAPDASIMLM